eukprot:TRINITY_DN12266_c0_g1_i3.p1 TRINITY_DN12266_c0_g1~~TRINITY_DN12266_c0_g1_i3.p1  ORF type:complete len:357 (-),score=41.92 TRINITY_DN12266_c0_g1_i3:20-1090(-)
MSDSIPVGRQKLRKYVEDTLARLASNPPNVATLRDKAVPQITASIRRMLEGAPPGEPNKIKDILTNHGVLPDYSANVCGLSEALKAVRSFLVSLDQPEETRPPDQMSCESKCVARSAVSLSAFSLNGDSILDGVEFPVHDRVSVIRDRVENLLGKKVTLTANGAKLCEDTSIKDSGLVEGDIITAIVKDKVTPQRTGDGSGNWAELREDGSVYCTWAPGTPCHNHPALAANVVSIYSCGAGYAALHADGSVFLWPGRSNAHLHEKDCQKVMDMLNDGGVQSICHTGGAYAALKFDGSVLSWTSGKLDGWGNGPLKGEVKVTADTKSITSEDGTFTALKNDGSVISWTDDDLPAELK